MATPTPPLLERLGKYGREGTNRNINGADVAELVKGYTGLIDLLPNSNTPAIAQPLSKEKKPLTHMRLKQFVSKEFDLCQYGLEEGCRVSVLIPNGPELAVAMVSVLSRWCAAPINPTNTREEIRSELLSTQAQAIIILAGAAANEAALQAAESVGLGVLVITPSDSTSGLFSISPLRPVIRAADCKRGPSVAETVAGFTRYEHPETVLLLHTSGTSGNKKLVPYSLDMVINGVGCIVSSWNLKPSDVCLNMMPLFHIGGIMRNILSPILSGGCVIACSGFDPLLFWDVLYSRQKVTWYYAAPTMHHALLMEAANRLAPLPVQDIRFTANAAGGLLPVLAEGLRTTFNAVILTSYGMTECMPISSPPQTYRLDPTGTSGIPVGPEVIIVDVDVDATKSVGPGVKGNILVRGAPCFGGYENNGTATEESFFCVNGKEGWFNTGDMGHLDENNYLFISGRSKEVINRGGETISPFEIEEAIIQHPMIKDTIAFSAPHAEFQETVGAVIVTHPDKPRPDLLHLHKYLEDKLHRSKWPQVIIYMDALPKNAGGKVLRIKMAERTGLKDIDEESSQLTRLYEATCPKINTPLTVKIPISAVDSDPQDTERFLLDEDSRVQKATVLKVDLPFRRDAFVGFVEVPEKQRMATRELSDMAFDLEKVCEEELPQYRVPLFIHIMERLPVGPESIDRLNKLAIQLFNEKNVIEPRNEIEKEMEVIWRSQLGSTSIISVVESFFDLGGDSLKAGQLVAAMRKKLKVDLSVADLLTAPTIEAMATKVSILKTLGGSTDVPRSPTKRGQNKSSILKLSGLNLADLDEEDKYQSVEGVSPYSSASFSCLLMQSLPIVLIGPLQATCKWFLWAFYWVLLQREGLDRLYSLLVAIVMMKATMGTVGPFIGIAAKWLIVGKYKSGRYPLWGNMYLRWWLVNQVISVFGQGFFKDDFPIIGPQLVRWYYIMMGAKIGKNVKINANAQIGEWDLLTIGDDVCIDNATVQPFTLDEGHFILLPIKIGSQCSVGVKSVISPGTDMPAGTSLGPLSSTYEMHDAQPHYRNYCRTSFAGPPQWLILCLGSPILLFVDIVCRIPWFFGLYCMVHVAITDGWYVAEIKSIYDAFLWWVTPDRMIFYFSLRVLNRCVVPYVRLSFAIFFKWTIIGKFTPMSPEEKAKPWNKFRYWLMQRLLPGGGLAGVARLVGTHYSIISAIFRALGAKIGKYVYWPGSGLEIVEYDLLEVGDNVTFGSRSVVMTSTAIRSGKVTFEAGAMIADRCVVLPGVTMRRGSVLGSGSLAAENFEAPVGSVWVGSRHGSAMNAAPADLSYGRKDTLTSFAKAFYHREVDYFVIPLSFIVMYNTLWQAFCTCFRHAAIPLSLLSVHYMMIYGIISDSKISFYKYVILTSIVVHLVLSVMALSIDVATKWAVIGRRKQGLYSWDTSTYCQRWQLHLTLQEIRRAEGKKAGLLEKLQGSQWLVWYFRALGCTIGRNVCLYPNGGGKLS
jgi:acyl-CoA synthetase (AMP-forming)/AMP-acid ligase II/acetyltransferase-like isoleucine patch superfamily enzyme/acyl carrier protein